MNAVLPPLDKIWKPKGREPALLLTVGLLIPVTGAAKRAFSNFIGAQNILLNR
jgi:hypothetical protein